MLRPPAFSWDRGNLTVTVYRQREVNALALQTPVGGKIKEKVVNSSAALGIGSSEIIVSIESSASEVSARRESDDNVSFRAAFFSVHPVPTVIIITMARKAKNTVLLIEIKTKNLCLLNSIIPLCHSDFCGVLVNFCAKVQLYFHFIPYFPKKIVILQ